MRLTDSELLPHVLRLSSQTSYGGIPSDDIRKRIPKYSEANFPKILSLVNKFKEIGARHNATAGQVGLAFMLAQGDDILPIPGCVE